MSAPQDRTASRRRFLALGAALTAGACASSPKGKKDDRTPPTDAENLRVWQAGAGKPYEVKAPGVCTLPGPNKKTRFPDPDKYKDVERVHSMCQLCSTVCGITGIVKDGRIIKVEGNPNDPNSRGRLCARGQAALNHQYHPERLLYPLRRVGPRGSGRWKRITWDEAYDEIAEKLRGVLDSGKPEEFA
ncbi:MAG: molybdopterin-dependent oxidoreductase, partial [Planctomycetota bacterium]